MNELDHLFENNRRWGEKVRGRDADFFERLSAQQNPDYLWIGCSDSRVPANEIVGLLPGEVFVHRNVANVVVHTDLNCLSVLQYAVEFLDVDHIMVVGHYGCGGIRGALVGRRLGLVDNWLRHVKDVHQKHATSFGKLATPELVEDRLCELNVIEQVQNVCQTTVLQEAWERGQNVTVHGWIYRLQTGALHNLGATIASPNDIETTIQAACRRLTPD